MKTRLTFNDAWIFRDLPDDVCICVDLTDLILRQVHSHAVSHVAERILFHAGNYVFVLEMCKNNYLSAELWDHSLPNVIGQIITGVSFKHDKDSGYTTIKLETRAGSDYIRLFVAGIKPGVDFQLFRVEEKWFDLNEQLEPNELPA